MWVGLFYIVMIIGNGGVATWYASIHHEPLVAAGLGFLALVALALTVRMIRDAYAPDENRWDVIDVASLFRKVDCHSLPVDDLDKAIAFYGGALGHELIWRDGTAAGLRLPDTDAELVLHTDARPIETDLLVNSVPAAIETFVRAGGKLLVEPFEIRIGLCAVLEDPWRNPLVILDQSKGQLRTDADRNVVGTYPPEERKP